jgi:hypothetical protein
MKDAQDAEQEPSPPPYARLPLPVMALSIVVFLGLLLGAGLYANANLRPQGIVLPTARNTNVAASGVRTSAPTATFVGAAATPTVRVEAPAPTRVSSVSTSAPTPQAQSTVLSEEVDAGTPASTPLVLVLGTATPDSGEIATARATSIVVMAPPTVTPEAAAEIGDAYQAYWQVRAEALYELDTSHLQEVMAGEHLSAAEDLIEQLRSEGRAIQTNVSHNYVVIDASTDAAKVADDYTDDSVYVDATTRTELTQPTGATIREQYQMNKIEGIWRVTSLVRASD